MILVAALALLVAWSAAERTDARARSTARLPVQAAEPLVADVRVEAHVTLRDGATTGPVAVSGARLDVGTSATYFLVAGNSQGLDLCNVGFTAEPEFREDSYVWKVDVRVTGVSKARASLEIGWTRFRGRVSESEGRRTISLPPGRDHLFDYVTAPLPSRSACANLMLRISAEPSARVANPEWPLTFDVWLLHRGDRSERWVHQQVEGTSGRKSPFRLDDLRWDLDGAVASGQHNGVAVSLGVRGTLLATPRQDGYLDVSVTIVRSLSVPTRLVRSGGEQQFVSAEGETAEIVLPPPTGRTSTGRPAVLPAHLAEGVLAGANTVDVDLGRFFAGSQTSLYVRVRRAPRAAGH